MDMEKFEFKIDGPLLKNGNMYEYIDGDKIVLSTLEKGDDLIIKDQWKREYH